MGKHFSGGGAGKVRNSRKEYLNIYLDLWAVDGKEHEFSYKLDPMTLVW